MHQMIKHKVSSWTKTDEVKIIGKHVISRKLESFEKNCKLFFVRNSEKLDINIPIYPLSCVSGPI